MCGSAALPDDAFCDWLAELTLAAVPAHVLAAMKRGMLDTLAVGWAGMMADGVGPVLDWVRTGGAGRSTLWGQAARLQAPAAALGNGLLSAALDFDIVHDGNVAHTHIVMLPALLALGEEVGARGEDFFAAYIGGCEMAVRLGLGLGRNPGWLGSSVLGVVAGAAACARLLRLGRNGVWTATGIALSRAAGTQQALIEGKFTKRLQTAFAARDAVEAAMLAQCGITAPRQIYNGRAGFQALYLNLSNADPLDRLGIDWLASEGTFKRYPSCFGNHAAIVAAQRAAGQPLDPDNIASCDVTLPAFSAGLVGGPFQPDANPQVSAQFSVRYSVACALVRGGLTLADIQAEAVLDPRVGGLANRIRVHVDHGAREAYTPVTVEVRLRAGGRRTARVEVIPGTRQDPADPEDWRVKARDCFTSGPSPLTPAEFTLLADRVDCIGSLANLDRFWSFGDRESGGSTLPIKRGGAGRPT